MLSALPAIGLLLAWSGCQVAAYSEADMQTVDVSAGRTIEADTVSHDVYYIRAQPGPEVLATGVGWMPFLRQRQIISGRDWREGRITFEFDRMAENIEAIMPQIVDAGYLMLDIETGPLAKEWGTLDEWIAGVNEAIRIAVELCPEGTIIGSFPGPSHQEGFTEDSYAALDYSTGLYFPIHRMDRGQMEALEAELTARSLGDLPVIVYLWWCDDPPPSTRPPTEPSIWSGLGSGKWVPERVVRDRVRDALEIFSGTQIVTRGSGQQAARVAEIALEVIDEWQ